MEQLIIKKSKGFVVYLDVYGFEAIVETKELKDITTKMIFGYQEINKLIEGRMQYKAEKFILSDCIFMYYPVKNKRYIINTLQRCIDDTKEILSIFLNKKLPLRGGIAYGDVICHDNLLVGEPVTRAVKYEKWIAAPLVLLPEFEVIGNIPKNPIGRMPNNFFKDIQIKDEKSISAKLIMPAETETFEKFIDECAERYLLYGPYEVARAWENARAYKNDFYNID